MTPRQAEAYRAFVNQSFRSEVSDDQIREYISVFFAAYRKTLGQFFPNLAPSIPEYANYPYDSFVLRLGNVVAMIGHRPVSGPESYVTVMTPADFDPPMDTVNIFDVAKQWQATFISADLRPRSYSTGEAEVEGTYQALEHALESFWLGLDIATFDTICVDLLHAEGIELQRNVRLEGPNTRVVDALGQVLITEPANYRRYETWAFEFKNWRQRHVSLELFDRLESILDQGDPHPDLVCLITPGDVTSIVQRRIVANPRIRLWNRSVLNLLVNKHLDVISPYFRDYDQASRYVAASHRLRQYDQQLKDIPSGQEQFAEYEKIGTEMWQFLFSPMLGPGETQVRTLDGVQRRDVLFRNQRGTRFWQRVADRYDADTIIVDFKNYAGQIDGGIISDVAHYANKALGRLIFVVSREGAGKSARNAQVRVLRDNDVVVVVVSDVLMLEMVERKERHEEPADVLEDLLDDLLRSY